MIVIMFSYSGCLILYTDIASSRQILMSKIFGLIGPGNEVAQFINVLEFQSIDQGLETHST